MEVKSKVRGGTRCCMCFDPFAIHDVSIYVFFCCHAYHETCLMDSIDSIISKKKPAAPTHTQDDLSYYQYDNGDDEDEDEDGNDDARAVIVNLDDEVIFSSSSRFLSIVSLVSLFFKTTIGGDLVKT
ncbi:UNVERIFIED_CONTAM: Vacuolar protein sorting-associated protein 41 [Sesamum latifolium]|uniref:Vacuolar protein sorting-associated protein 41 n=1 Tax=Sesamum latifolium TaxID=2727402 RepID=A0AAW2Y4H7_9LAMI